MVNPGGQVNIDGSDLFLRYAPVTEAATAYIKQEVRIEFCARSTGEPNQSMPVRCDAAPHAPGIRFPEAEPRVLAAERTFWEKVMAAHSYCKQSTKPKERYARHWYDLAQIAGTKHMQSAIADKKMGRTVAAHNATFFPKTNLQGQEIDLLDAAVKDQLQIVPTGEARQYLSQDYQFMIGGDMFFGTPPLFDEVMETCAKIEYLVNGKHGSG